MRLITHNTFLNVYFVCQIEPYAMQKLQFVYSVSAAGQSSASRLQQ